MEEEKKGLTEVSFGMLVLTILIIGVVGYMLINPVLQTDDEIKYLENKIDNLNGVSDEFRDGFLSCIEYLRDYRYSAANVTEVN